MRFAGEAQISSHREPPTSTILPGMSESVLARSFPKRPTKATKLHQQTVKEATVMITRAARAGKDVQHHLVALERHALNRPAAEGGHGLRLDLTLQAGTDEEMAVDVSLFESTCATYHKAQLEWHKELQEGERKARARGAPPPKNTKQPSKAMLGRVAHKHSKYAPITNLAAIMNLQRKRQRKLRMVAAVASHSGELAGDFINLIEWVTKHYKRLVTKGRVGYNGLPPARRAAEFRGRFKNAVQVIIASAGAALIFGAGTADGNMTANFN